MAQQKIVLKKGTTREEVLDTIDGAVVAYMGKKRGLDELAARKLIHEDKPTFESYMRKIDRAVWTMISAGIPAQFFGK